MKRAAQNPDLGRRADWLDPGGRSRERLRAHYEIERELANRLRTASREERKTMYTSVYDELFRRVPDHPQHTVGAESGSRSVAGEERIVRKLLREGGVFLEVGAGDCALSLAISRYASHTHAVDVSEEISTVERTPPNFTLWITDGTSIPVRPGTVDLAYSNQLMEHLHPDDAEEQLANVLAALAPGGRYVCLTPHRWLGPSDISAFFTVGEAEGFHLREYTTRELIKLARHVGFLRVRVLAVLGDRVVTLPSAPFALLDLLFGALPRGVRAQLKRYRLVQKALSPGGGVVAIR